VTGAAALAINAGFSDPRSRLISTAIDLGPPGFDIDFGYGRVDAYSAVVPTPSALVLALVGLSMVQRKLRRRC